MTASSPVTQHKAPRLNLDPSTYGTFAEIGACQELARWVHVGNATGTMAKSISAYDMALSDRLYGETEHYVAIWTAVALPRLRILPRPLGMALTVVVVAALMAAIAWLIFVLPAYWD